MAITDGARTPELPRIETTPVQAEQERFVEQSAAEAGRVGATESPAYALPVIPEPVAVVSPDHQSTLDKEIEQVLSEGLEQLYWELPETQRQVFKAKGEQVASQVRQLLGEATVRVRDIFRLIADWLKGLPGVSKFFIEQEAKIKTDKLTKLRS